ncbi:MAG: hypothetical protein WC043_07040 [Pseudobdellovibrionaceae bacterium]
MDDLISFAYSLLPLVNSWAYLPQAVRLFTCERESLKSMSLWSWMTWLCCSVITLLYGVFKLHDPLFILVASVSVFWNVLIVGITLWRTRPNFQNLSPLPSGTDSLAP